MARSVAEWIGKTDDSVPPPRVRDRVLRKHEGRCANCGNKITGTFTCDHIKALINGGENRETNLQPLCRVCTPIKDRADVAEKSRVYEKRKAHFGLKQPKGRPIPGSRRSGWKVRLTSQGPRAVRR